jgi:hypothetical protein
VLGTYAMLLEWTYSRYTTFTDRLRLLGCLVLESFGYRQLTVIWRLRGLIKFLRGRTDWGRMERRGFASPPAPPPVNQSPASAA